MQYGYARVSTVQQDTALQLAALKRAGVKRVVEEKRSGGGVVRPALESLLRALGPGDCLVVYKIDRLARSMSDLLRILEAVFRSGATFRSLTEPIDTRTPVGEFLLHILGAVAQLERSIIRERCAAGRAAALARGVQMGRPRSYDYREMLRLVDELGSRRAAAEALGCAHSTVVKAVRRVRDGRTRVDVPGPLV